MDFHEKSPSGSEASENGDGRGFYVKLNVGGTLHITTIHTLASKDTMLKTMFTTPMGFRKDSEGFVRIDRCGKHFGTILNWLRDGDVPLPSGPTEIEELYHEAKYYLCEELLRKCESALQCRTSPMCHVPLITSPREENLLISNTKKPVIKLQVNRHNKYSYTVTSDDNLLKSIELFDKLSLRFNGRILFLKDVISNAEICCWSFFGHGKKVAEVCCTSIVYASDRKHTKVDFPEARVLEESLNILLYEQNVDTELLQATRSRQRVNYNDEDDDRSCSVNSANVQVVRRLAGPAAPRAVNNNS
ncbi:BTB/POZ domain-containing adapter for CUL3-mediated RhoA degradation protein 3-like [Paramacrobiotus metropolitanus]|uniref:BTB/POZ domain-containing adapter for CUL3-mediated RhoA degradation protein 3-like n=1 Tax=Paramacrobiotus metropolitanus TaxID=2943436 RepID=UPI002445D30F|nr:BTB/POZ domain-containing adapter for CUL3-mediated RhoA degradation protein 3-like [Paramacrobiotus metropolitanus]